MLAHFDAMMECHLSTHLAAMDLCVTSEFQIQRTVPIYKLVCCYFTAFLCIFEPAAESQERAFSTQLQFDMHCRKPSRTHFAVANDIREKGASSGFCTSM